MSTNKKIAVTAVILVFAGYAGATMAYNVQKNADKREAKLLQQKKSAERAKKKAQAKAKAEARARKKAQQERQQAQTYYQPTYQQQAPTQTTLPPYDGYSVQDEIDGLNRIHDSYDTYDCKTTYNSFGASTSCY